MMIFRYRFLMDLKNTIQTGRESAIPLLRTPLCTPSGERVTSSMPPIDLGKLTSKQMQRLMPFANYARTQKRFHQAAWGIFLGEIALKALLAVHLPWFTAPAAFGLLVMVKFIYEAKQSLRMWGAESYGQAIWSALKKEWIMVVVAVFLALYRFGFGWAWWAMLGCYSLYYFKRKYDLKQLERGDD